MSTPANLTEEQITLLERLWADDRLSTTKIGVEFRKAYRQHPGVLTGSAVAGLVYRLREKGRNFPPRSTAQRDMHGHVLGYRVHREVQSKAMRTRKDRERKELSRREQGIAPRQPPDPERYAKQPLEVNQERFKAAPEQKLKYLAELGVHECHWPLEQGGKTLYCGAPGYPYCAAHSKGTYVRTKARS